MLDCTFLAHPPSSLPFLIGFPLLVSCRHLAAGGAARGPSAVPLARGVGSNVVRRRERGVLGAQPRRPFKPLGGAGRAAGV